MVEQDTENEFSLIEQSEQLETRFALEELETFEQLIKELNKEKKNDDVIKTAVGQLSWLTNSLATAHGKFLAHIMIISRAYPKETEKITQIEQSLQKIVDNFLSMFAPGEYILFYAKTKNYTELKKELELAKSSLIEWITLLTAFTKEFSITKTKYNKTLAGMQKKISDLLKGTGYYAKYSQSARANLWNRYVKVSVQRAIKNIDLSDADLSGFDFPRFEFKNVTLTSAKLTNASISFAIFNKVNLTGADLSHARLSDFQLLTEVTWENANLENTKFQNINLSHQNMQNMKELNYATFTACNLTNTNFSDSSLIRTRFESSNLCGTNFSGADLRASVFLNSVFGYYEGRRTNFANVDLSTVFFSNCVDSFDNLLKKTEWEKLFQLAKNADKTIIRMNNQQVKFPQLQ